jgi:hypothetical protein
MLFILHKANHPEVDYREGQPPLIHLQADVHATVKWADRHGIRWAFSDTNAGAKYAKFYSKLDRLTEINWAAVQATDFRSRDVMERKQAEFLLFERFPFDLVERIGVYSSRTLKAVKLALQSASHEPVASVEPGWYF